MNNKDGLMILKEFYKYMFCNGKMADFRDSAEVLNSAIRAMRKNRIPLKHWVMFVHIASVKHSHHKITVVSVFLQ